MAEVELAGGISEPCEAQLLTECHLQEPHNSCAVAADGAVHMFNLVVEVATC